MFFLDLLYILCLCCCVFALSMVKFAIILLYFLNLLVCFGIFLTFASEMAKMVDIYSLTKKSIIMLIEEAIKESDTPMIKELDKLIVGRGEVSGFTFTQLFCSCYAYLYEKRDDSTGKISYEVFRRVENSQFGCVSYPRSGGFGSSIYLGKELLTLERAKDYFSYLNDFCGRKAAV